MAGSFLLAGIHFPAVHRKAIMFSRLREDIACILERDPAARSAWEVGVATVALTPTLPFACGEREGETHQIV